MRAAARSRHRSRRMEYELFNCVPVVRKVQRRKSDVFEVQDEQLPRPERQATRTHSAAGAEQRAAFAITSMGDDERVAATKMLADMPQIDDVGDGRPHHVPGIAYQDAALFVMDFVMASTSMHIVSIHMTESVVVPGRL